MLIAVNDKGLRVVSNDPASQCRIPSDDTIEIVTTNQITNVHFKFSFPGDYYRVNFTLIADQLGKFSKFKFYVNVKTENGLLVIANDDISAENITDGATMRFASEDNLANDIFSDYVFTNGDNYKLDADQLGFIFHQLASLLTEMSSLGQADILKRLEYVYVLVSEFYASILDSIINNPYL